MKKYIKYITIFIIGILFLPIVTNAATVSLTKDHSVSGNKAKYFVTYKKEQTDTDDKVSFEIETSDSKVNISLTPGDDVSKESLCNDKQCTIILPSGDAAKEIGIAIATITLENTGTSETKPNLKVKMNDTLVASDNELSLQAGESDKKKSSDSTLKTLSFSISTALLDKTFDPNILDYTVTGIKDTISSVSVNTTCDNCEVKITCPSGGCSISNNNKVTLQTGSNQVAVNVTSEDGSSNKTYMLNIYRGDVITSSPYLQSLQIKDTTLSPIFSSLVNDYTAKVKKNVKDLTITATPEDPSAKIEIKGDKNLKNGENTVTVTVTSSDGENKQVYTIIVTKEVAAKKTTKKTVTTTVKKKKNNTWLIVLCALIALGLIIGGYFFIFKKKKKNKKDKNDKDNNNNKPNEDDNKEVLEQTSTNVDLNDKISEIEKENTDSLHILEETKKEMEEAPKQDVDEALDDLMKTKKLELGDLDF